MPAFVEIETLILVAGSVYFRSIQFSRRLEPISKVRTLCGFSGGFESENESWVSEILWAGLRRPTLPLIGWRGVPSRLPPYCF